MHHVPSRVPRHPRSTFGANLRFARRAAGLTQRQLADQLSVDPIQVSRWERGASRPSEDHAVALCGLLKRELPWFYSENAEAAA